MEAEPNEHTDYNARKKTKTKTNVNKAALYY